MCSTIIGSIPFTLYAFKYSAYNTSLGLKLFLVPFCDSNVYTCCIFFS